MIESGVELKPGEAQNVQLLVKNQMESIYTFNVNRLLISKLAEIFRLPSQNRTHICRMHNSREHQPWRGNTISPNFYSVG